MIRSLAVAFVLSFAGVAAALAAGTAYRDPEGRFTVTVPQGWTAEKPIVDKIALVMIQPRGEGIGGVCMVIVLPAPATQGSSQAEIDEALSKQFTEDYWKAGYTALGYRSTVGGKTVAVG